jgi:hypothetical protein
LPVLVLYSDRTKQMRCILSLGLLGTTLECAQLWIPTRWFEWQDIALSLAGLGVSWVVVEIVRGCFNRLFPRAVHMNHHYSSPGRRSKAEFARHR